MSTSSRARNTTVPNTRRIGWAKLPAVYWVAGLGSGKPQSQARRAAQRARGEAVDDHRAEAGGEGDEEEEQQPVVGAAGSARSARASASELPAGAAGWCRSASAITGASTSMNIAGQHARQQAQRGERRHRSHATSGRSRRASAAAGAARPAEERDAVGLHEAGGGERGRQRQQRADRRHQELQQPLRQRRAEQDGLEGQPFGDEAVERRQRRDRGRSR